MKKENVLTISISISDPKHTGMLLDVSKKVSYEHIFGTRTDAFENVKEAVFATCDQTLEEYEKMYKNTKNI